MDLSLSSRSHRYRQRRKIFTAVIQRDFFDRIKSVVSDLQGEWDLVSFLCAVFIVEAAGKDLNMMVGFSGFDIEIGMRIGETRIILS